MSPLRLDILKRFHFFRLCLLLLGLAILSIAPAQTAAAQTLAPPPVSIAPPPPPPKPPFLVRSYDGTKKCLDYGTPPSGSGSRVVIESLSVSSAASSTAPPPVASPSVFLNDCFAAHPIVVEEVNARHDVVLHAGNQVIGIHNPPEITVGGPPPPPQTEFALELQVPVTLAVSLSANQIFALDGDSIILASSRPCISTDSTLCAPPPPQLVVQVLNGSGINGTPLVVEPRNLADSEFWDFVATDNSGADPTSGFVHVATNYGLWNAVCASPMASAAGPPKNDDGTPAACSVFNAGWGSVIVITSPNDCSKVLGDVQDIGACIDLSAYAPLILPAGVTLRGNRRGTNFGPQLYAALYQEKGGYSPAISDAVCEWCVIQIHGDYVRITGLRLKGQSRAIAPVVQATQAIQVDFPGGPFPNYATTTEYISIIDHNDISDWEDATVNVSGGQLASYFTCDLIADDPGTLANVRIERNFLHHNERWSGGYASLMNQGARAVISKNTFLMNRHSIAADGEAHDEYRAWYNLVLSSVPDYPLDPCGFFLFNLTCFGVGGRQQDFDMHGTGPGGYGFIGGYRVDIAGNTFLGGNRYNFELRGHPCSVPHFRGNVTEDTEYEGGGQHAINLHHIGDPPVEVITQGPDVPSTPVTVLPYVPEPAPVAGDNGVNVVLASNNQFSNSSPAFSDPTAHLGVGDFDGDGTQDLFLATGTAWYYSPGGTAEWRFLSAKTDRIGTLLFGDFDGDGRTDVVAKNGDYLMVSWGGVSDWEHLNLNAISAPISDLAVGNFVNDFAGDQRDDIFWADGTSWYVSSGGSGHFNVVNTSSFRVKDLRFGDFDGDGKTDVFGVVDGSWSYSKSASGSWSSGFLQEALAPVAGLVVVDLNGDGFADVATNSHNNWTISYGGRGNWVHYQINDTEACPSAEPPLTQVPAIGRFDGNPGADVLLWAGIDSNELCIASGGTVGLQPYSRQDMR